MPCAKPKCDKPLGNPHLACRCGLGFCSEACFVAAWHSKHARQCPDGEVIKKEMLDKAGGPQAMLKNGAKFLMAVAVTKVFEAEGESPVDPVGPAPEVEKTDAATLLPRVPLEENTKALLAECAELRRAREGAEELNSELQAQVEQLDRDSSDSSERLQRALREVSRLEKQLAEMGGAGGGGDAKQLQAEVAKLRVENTDMWRDIAGLRAENHDLKDDLGDAKKALKVAEGSRKAMERAESAEEQLKHGGQDELKRLTDELKEREAAELQLQADVAKLQHQQEQSENLCASLQRQEEATCEVLNQKSEQLATMTSEKQRLQEEGRQYQEDLRAAVHRQSQLEHDLSSELQELEASQRQVQEASEKLRTSHQRCEESEVLRAEQGAALLVAQEEKKQLHDQNGQLMVNLQVADSKSQQLGEENQKLLAQLQYSEERGQCEMKVESLEQKLQEESRKSEEECIAWQQKMDQLSQDRHRLEETLMKVNGELVVEKSNTEEWRAYILEEQDRNASLQEQLVEAETVKFQAQQAEAEHRRVAEALQRSLEEKTTNWKDDVVRMNGLSFADFENTSFDSLYSGEAYSYS